MPTILPIPFEQQAVNLVERDRAVVGRGRVVQERPQRRVGWQICAESHHVIRLQLEDLT